MPAPAEPSPVSEARSTVEDATCLACGCLCDDLTITTAGGRIVQAARACPKGLDWLLADHGHDGLPAAAVDGHAAALEEAVDRAAAILRGAKAPVVLGLSRTSSETVAEAVAIADLLGAIVDPAGDPGDRSTTFAVQRVGRVSATLGEVKDRADVVVFWKCDPVVTHPRHWERYSVEPRGRFVPEGRAGRAVIVADEERTATAERADRFLKVTAAAEFDTLWCLRALLRGAVLGPAQARQATGIELDTLAELAGRLRSARYGAWFTGLAQSAAAAEAVLTLVRDLNAYTRFVVLGLGAAGNAAGAEAVLTWQTGYPSGVDLSRGSPRSLPLVTSAEAILSRGLADAALIVADAEPAGLSEPARAHLGRIPRVVIAPRATATGGTATVALVAATPGIDAGGTVMRSDGVVLTLRPPLAAGVATDRALLRALRERLDSTAEAGSP